MSVRVTCASLIGVAMLGFTTNARAEDGEPGATRRLEYTTEPLRLALTRDQFQFMGRMPGCESTTEPPVDRWLTRDLGEHLHFLAVVRSGCGMETGGGGGLTYSVELKPNFFVVASIGAWLTPPIDGVRDQRIDSVARLDFIWRLKEGRSINFGLFASNTAFGFGFGGVF